MITPTDRAERRYWLPPDAQVDYKPGFSVESVRSDFPILQRVVNGEPLIWLDNAATSQKPRPVIDACHRFMSEHNSNIHRGAHTMAKEATAAYETARESAARFLGAAETGEIVFVRGTTEAINLVAETFGRANVGAGDEIVVTELEHHSNFVPWQRLCEQVGATLRVAPIDDSGQVMVGAFHALLGPRTRMVALSHVSNVLGTIVPVEELTAAAHRYGATVLIDGAQAVPHLPVDVRQLGADFYVFSGHKLFAPTGIGVLYGRADLLQSMPPWQSGGGMIREVTHTRTTYAEPPQRFEAGTGSITEAVGLGAALTYLAGLDLPAAHRHEAELLAHGTWALSRIPGLRLLGTAVGKVATLAFTLAGVDPDHLAAHLDREGIAVRAGHHCAQPALRRFGLSSAVRPSLAFYNTHHEIETLARAVARH